MLIYILKLGKEVDVKDVAPYFADYIAQHYPKGQIFVKGLNSWSDCWHCLQRSGHHAGNSWVISDKVPSEIKLAQMIVN